MAKELTRTGVVGLELTREDVSDLLGKVEALETKAACREVNCEVLDLLAAAKNKVYETYLIITKILEG